MSFLSAIPLPLRIIAGLLLGVLVFSAAGSLGSSVFTLLAILAWLVVLIVLFYEFGWLNFLSSVPVLSRLLGWISNRRQVTDSDSVAKTEAPRGVLDDDERDAIYDSAERELNSLDGVEEARFDIEQKLVAPARQNPDNPFNTQSPAMVGLYHGPRGNGKTTAALCTSRMLVGIRALESAKVVTLRGSDLRGGKYNNATQLGAAKAEEAIDGTLLIDDADWLLTDSAYDGENSPGVDLGLAILDVVQRFPRRVFIVLTLSTAAAERLKQDEVHARWLGKLTVRDIAFTHLDAESLQHVLSNQLTAMGWQLEDDAARNAARRLLEGLQHRRGESFDNAEACRRMAESLVHAAADQPAEKRDERVVSRETVRLLDDQLE